MPRPRARLLVVVTRCRAPYGDAALLVTGRHILLFYTLMRVTGEGGGRAAAKHAAEKKEARGKE